jgi:hypothetical protein
MKLSSNRVCSRLTAGSSPGAKVKTVVGGCPAGEADPPADTIEGWTDEGAGAPPPQAAMLTATVAAMVAERNRGRDARVDIGSSLASYDVTDS